MELPPEFPLPQGPGYWSLTRHAHILEASRSPEIFCSGKGATSVIDIPPVMNEFFGGMINMDEPRHGAQRRIISRGFTPRALRRIEAAVDRRAQSIIDRVIEKGECDFVNEIAAPLPLEIICEMMGIPESQSQFVFERSNLILGLGDPDYRAEGEDPIMKAMKAGSELASLMNEMAEARRKSPQEDLVSALIHAADGDDAMLTDAELASFFILLVVAGNETTRNAISHGMKALCDYPDERRRWQADFEGLAAGAVEEIVRWASPVIYMRRTLTQDTVLDGVAMKEGDKVALWYASANRDEDVFSDPDLFDITRSPNDHLAFGIGEHFCLGANLARLEIRVMFEHLLRRMPDVELAGPIEYLRSHFIDGVKHMPVRFTPEPS
jgi:cytochrome P450